MAKVLLVDDDDGTRSVLEALLRYDGHEVLLAANGKQALILARDRRPEVVLSDIRMPGMEGTEFCRELRKDPDIRDIYVILATGYDSPEQKTEGIASGADDYVGKPVRADELAARMRMALRIRGLQQEVVVLKRKAAEGEKARGEVEAFAARLAKLRGDLTESLGTRLDEARRLVDTARQGDLKSIVEGLEKLVAGVEELRSRVAPREGS